MGGQGAGHALYPARGEGRCCDIDWNYNFIDEAYWAVTYYQINLTDYCHDGVCDAHPKYLPAKQIYDHLNSDEAALAYCMDVCTFQAGFPNNTDSPGCVGFFYQKHTNDHEICGFYRWGSALHLGTKVKHPHTAGVLATIVDC